jgi:hypothetical protein
VKDDSGQILGRTITGVIMKESGERYPNAQLFLLFSDGTYYELYGEHIHGSGPDRGGKQEVLDYTRGRRLAYQAFAKP